MLSYTSDCGGVDEGLRIGSIELFKRFANSICCFPRTKSDAKSKSLVLPSASKALIVAILLVGRF